MALPNGTHLGPYEILSALGSGGMGEVYRARDTRLDRAVAIKILPSHLGERAELRERFEREARAVSALNHPNICTLYDIGRQDGIDFIVLELLEGDNLSERIAKGPLPLADVLRYATEIADALDKAHRHGVVHRDLKPGNVMLTKAGSKLLDFGLAKISAPAAFQPIAGDDKASGSAAVEAGLTVQGAMLGTLHYMSPEQLEGSEADPRSDIFSLGVLIYEMISGRRAFQGKSHAAVVAAILDKEPPPLSTIELSVAVPVALERTIRRCLEKEADDRWQSCRDLVSELKWIAQDEEERKRIPPSGVVPIAVKPEIEPRRAGIAWVLAGVLLASTVTFAVLYLRQTPAASSRLRFSVVTPVSSGPSHLAISPDGKSVVYIGRTLDGAQRLFLRSLETNLERVLAGTEVPLHPFWSPDSRYVGFFSAGNLKRVDVTVAGSTAQEILKGANGVGGTWNRDNVIVFTNGKVLHRVSAEGASDQPISSLDAAAHETAYLGPYFLPDGQHFIYLGRNEDAARSAIYVRSLDSTNSTRLFEADSVAAYASGYLIFLRDETLMLRPFDEGKLTVGGDAIPLLGDPVANNPLGNRPGFSFSQNGVLTFRTAAGNQKRRLTWFDRSGRKGEAVGPVGTLGEWAVSPDEKKIAIEMLIAQDKSDIALLDTASGESHRFTFGENSETAPIWSNDGSRIFFSSGVQKKLDIFMKLSNGSGNEERFFHSAATDVANPEDVSMDGKYLLLKSVDNRGNADLWTLTLGDLKPTPYLQAPTSHEINGRISPDGHWVAYSSNEAGGRYEVYVQSFPTAGGKRQVSTSGGYQPTWRKDGKELFFLSLDSRIMSASVKGDTSLEISAPQALFDSGLTLTVPSPTGRAQYYASRDGQRFLVNLPEANVTEPITVIVNWPTLLKK